jgi:NADH:ubiquinone oxidoreductase subunit 2 (subunit N)
MIMIFGPTTLVTSTPQDGFKINDLARHEASIKYFYLSTFSSSLVLISAVLFYTLAQTGNFIELNHWFTPNHQSNNNLEFLSLA